MNGSLSQEYIIERGVRQGSVLSPSLFLLLIDSLLQALKEANAGVNLEGVYMGSLAHADDLRSLTLDPQSSKQQAEIIDDFLAKNFLQLNTNKCELVVHAHGTQSHTISVDVGGISLEPSHASKCLGTWWTPNLSPTKAIMENIGSARRAFFSFGSIGVFHGSLNPLSSRSVVETCVMPILLFGSECWYLSDPTLDELEQFQCSTGKRILRLPRFHSNTAVLMGLEWPSMRARVLIRKLNFLRRLVGEREEKVHRFFTFLLKGMYQSLQSLSNVAIYLEASYGTNCTGDILTSAESWGIIKKKILSADKDYRAKCCNNHQHLSTIHSEISWLKIWDTALDHGVRGSRAALCVFNTLSRPLFGDRLCPRCEVSIAEDSTYLEHLSFHHPELNLGSAEDIITAITSASPDIFSVGNSLMSSMPPA